MRQRMSSWGRIPRIALAVSCLALSGCAQQARPTATVAPPQGQLACFRHLDVGMPRATPQLTRAQAIAAMRAAYDNPRKNVQLGEVVHEEYVGIRASDIRSPASGADELAGRDVWVVGFSDGSERRYALIDGQTGRFASGCGGPEATFRTLPP